MMNEKHQQLKNINIINDSNNDLMNNSFYRHSSKAIQKNYNNNHYHIIKDHYYRTEDNYNIHDFGFYMLLYDVDIYYENYSLIDYKKRKRNKTKKKS
jgi:hypothetical protein